MTGKTTLWYVPPTPASSSRFNFSSCRIIQDLQSSSNGDVGIAYYYFGGDINNSLYMIRPLQFWILQLASQCQSLPSELLSQDLYFQKLVDLPESKSDKRYYSGWEAPLRSLLAPLFTKFRRTFFLIDGLDEIVDAEASATIVGTLQHFLEQDFGNVSIAIFSRPIDTLEPLLQLADVSIRVTQVEPNLINYIQFKVGQKVKPVLMAEQLDHDEQSLALIETVLTEASAGL